MLTLYWYTKDPKGRKVCNGIAVTDYNRLTWAQATCSKKDIFVKKLARTIVSQRIDKATRYDIKSVMHCKIDEKLSLEDNMKGFMQIKTDPQNNEMNDELIKIFLGRVYNLLKRFEK